MLSQRRSWSSRPSLYAATLSVILIAPGHALAQQTQLGADTMNAGNFRGQAGRRLTYVCPSEVVNSPYTVWGTNIYSDDSQICLAALHAGALIARKAAVVTLLLGPGTAGLMGSTQHDVTTESYAQYVDYTFTFDTSGAPGQVDWMTTARGIEPDFAQPITVLCPRRSGRETYDVWGTDLYHADSSICFAAQHAGVITADGGSVTLTMTGAKASYEGKPQNGVNSLPYGEDTGGFRVALASQNVAPPAATKGLVVRADAQGRTTVTWPETRGATYITARWKVGDALCCNAGSPPGAPLTNPTWQDGPLPGAGTYGYRVYTTSAGTLSAQETSFTWTGAVSSAPTATGQAGGGTLLTEERKPSSAPAVAAAPSTAPVPGPQSTKATFNLNTFGWGAVISWSPVEGATAYNVYRIKATGDPGILLGTVSAADAGLFGARYGSSGLGQLGALDPAIGASYWVDAVLAGGRRSDPGSIGDVSGAHPPQGYSPQNLRATLGGTGNVTTPAGTPVRGNRVTWTWDPPPAAFGGAPPVYFVRLDYTVKAYLPLVGTSFSMSWTQHDVVRTTNANEPFVILAPAGVRGPPYTAAFEAGNTITFCVSEMPITGSNTTAPGVSCLDTQLPP